LKKPVELLTSEAIFEIENFRYTEYFDDMDSVDTERKLFPWQKQAIKSFYDEHFVIINKQRQIGASSFFINFATYLAMTNSFYNILYVDCNRRLVNSVSKEIITIVKNKDEDLIQNSKGKYTNFNPEDVNLGNYFFNKDHIKIEFRKTSSTITVTSYPENFVNKDEKYNLIIFDEAAFIRNMREVYDSLVPDCLNYQFASFSPSNPYGVLIASTLDNYDDMLQFGAMPNWFTSCWNDAINYCNAYVPIEVLNARAEQLETEDKSIYVFSEE